MNDYRSEAARLRLSVARGVYRLSGGSRSRVRFAIDVLKVVAKS
jgi:ABC-type cobalamin transport system ATPase subunit